MEWAALGRPIRFCIRPNARPIWSGVIYSEYDRLWQSMLMLRWACCSVKRVLATATIYLQAPPFAQRVPKGRNINAGIEPIDRMERCRIWIGSRGLQAWVHFHVFAFTH